MSKYNNFAKQLDKAFKDARTEYKAAFSKFKEIEKTRSSGAPGTIERQRAELEYKAAEDELRAANERIWGAFARKRAELRRELASQITADTAANPDSVDQNGLDLLKSGILSANDYYAMAEKYNGNPTMLRILAKYTKEAADNPEMQRNERIALHELVERCQNGYNALLQTWDDLSKVADYCSGQAHKRPGSPAYTVSMGERWEQLAGDTVESF